MKTTRALFALPLVLALPACLELEEEIEVRPDGSVDVHMKAHGDSLDLGTGYALPLGAPWEPVGDDTVRWLSTIGPDTGSPQVRERIASGVWPPDPGERAAEITLAARASFRSVDDLPRSFVPASDPYRSAYLQRTTELDVRRDGGRTVYAFRRVFHGRDVQRSDPIALAKDALPDELVARIGDDRPVSGEEWAAVTRTLCQAYEATGEHYARNAIVGLYTEGDASLSGAGLAAVLAGVREATGRLTSVEETIALARWYETDEDEREGPDPLNELEGRFRTALRRSLAGGLERAGVGEPARNGILFALEWNFTSVDATTDLLDEELAVRLRLPGVLVAGNHDEVDGGAACWRFDAKVLEKGDRELWAVSVLDGGAK